MNSFVTCDFFKDVVVLYALYVHCTRAIIICNKLLLTYLLSNGAQMPGNIRFDVKFCLKVTNSTSQMGVTAAADIQSPASLSVEIQHRDAVQ